MARKPTKPKNVVRFVAFGCRHHPLADEDAMDWLCEQIRDVRPDFVIDLGDRYEADSASRWPSEYDWSLEHEYAEANRWDAHIREAAPNASRVFLPGNHDDNLLAIDRIDKRVRGLCDWRRPQFDEYKKPINTEIMCRWDVVTEYTNCKKLGCFRLGQATFYHGYEAGTSSDRNQAVRFGSPFGLCVSVHTHRPVEVTQAMLTKRIGLPYWYANAGTMRDLKPEFVKRKDTDGWGHACVVGEVDLRAGPAKSPRMSRRWSAETRILKTFGRDDSPIKADWML